MKQVDIYTDGSCLNNNLYKDRNNPGGWAAVLRCNNNSKEISGGIKETTNVRAEMTAVIKALQCIKSPCNITMIIDSELIVKTMNLGWKKNKNKDLWKELQEVINAINCEIEWIWLKGHAGNIYNERCNKLAQVKAIRISARMVTECLEE